LGLDFALNLLKIEVEGSDESERVQEKNALEKN